MASGAMTRLLEEEEKKEEEEGEAVQVV